MCSSSGRSTASAAPSHLVNTVQHLSARGVGRQVLTGQGAQIDTTAAAGRLVFGTFSALAEFGRELIRERTALVHNSRSWSIIALHPEIRGPA